MNSSRGLRILINRQRAKKIPAQELPPLRKVQVPSQLAMANLQSPRTMALQHLQRLQ